MICSDLHIHSTFSDGILYPWQIVGEAKKKKLQYISITDHDSIQSQYELEKLQCSDLNIISGVEISTEYEGHELHILGYFINIFDSSLIKMLGSVRKARMDRVYNIIEELRKLEIDINEKDICINEHDSVGRPHIAKILLEKGYVSNLKEAFSIYLAKDRPAYVARYKLSYKEVLKIIALSGGLSVLAHPGELYRGINLERLVKDLKMYGLNGIEVFHPSHCKGDVSKYYSIAKKYNLVICGGSDYHCDSYLNDRNIGLVGLDYNLTNKFLTYYKNWGAKNELF